MSDIESTASSWQPDRRPLRVRGPPANIDAHVGVQLKGLLSKSILDLVGSGVWGDAQHSIQVHHAGRCSQVTTSAAPAGMVGAVERGAGGGREVKSTKGCRRSVRSAAPTRGMYLQVRRKAVQLAQARGLADGQATDERACRAGFRTQCVLS